MITSYSVKVYDAHYGTSAILHIAIFDNEHDAKRDLINQVYGRTDSVHRYTLTKSTLVNKPHAKWQSQVIEDFVS